MQKAIIYTYCNALYNGQNGRWGSLEDYRTLIKEKRKEKGISQNQLAKQLGISQPYMNQIESGARNPTLPLLIKICETLDIPMFRAPEENKTPGEA